MITTILIMIIAFSQNHMSIGTSKPKGAHSSKRSTRTQSRYTLREHHWKGCQIKARVQFLQMQIARCSAVLQHEHCFDEPCNASSAF